MKMQHFLRWSVHCSPLRSWLTFLKNWMSWIFYCKVEANGCLNCKLPFALLLTSTSSQSIETDSLMLICKTTWLLQLPHLSHASESLLCEPSTHPFCQTDLGADWVCHFVTLLPNYFGTSVFHFRVWSEVSTFKWDSFTHAYFAV